MWAMGSSDDAPHGDGRAGARSVGREFDLVLDVGDRDRARRVVPDARATAGPDREEQDARRAEALDAAGEFEARGTTTALLGDETEGEILRQTDFVAVRERDARCADTARVHGEFCPDLGRDAPARAGMEVLDETQHGRMRRHIREERQVDVRRAEVTEALRVTDCDEELPCVVDGEEEARRAGTRRGHGRGG